MQVMKEMYVGIDISKEKLNLCYKRESMIVLEVEIKNVSSVIKKQLRKDIKTLGAEIDEVRVCAEYTGRYIYPLVCACNELGVFLWMEDPTRIKNSLGLSRGKNDVMDARRIAEYAERYNDKAVAYSRLDKDVQAIRNLLSDRDLLITQRKTLESQLHDQKGFMSGEDYKRKAAHFNRIIKTLNDQIASIEEEMRSIIKDNEEFCHQFALLMTIPGVGEKLAINMIAITNGFRRFENARQFNCYAGLAPFKYDSGKSIRSKARVSQRANKHIKALLHLCALCTATHMLKGECREYYERRTAEGKHPMCILNIVRAKLVARMFSVIKRDTPYVDEYAIAC